MHVVAFNTLVFLLGMSHLKAVLSDPGTVPLSQSRLDFSDLHHSAATGGGRHQRGGDSDADEWTVCTRCETYRPPRAHHCRICKRCIRRMDHHCPWINNCVGERNQKFFLQFLVYVALMAIYSVSLVVGSWVYPCDTCAPEFPGSQQRMLHSVLLLLESALFGLFVIAIMVDQMHAIMYDETAVEAVQTRGGYRPVRTIRSKLKLLADVCGRDHPALWLLPCSNGDRSAEFGGQRGGGSYGKYEQPLLHDV